MNKSITDKAITKRAVLGQRCRPFLLREEQEKHVQRDFSSYFCHVTSRDCSSGVSSQWPLRLILPVRRHFKAPGTGWPRHYSTNLFKQLIVRQRRLQHTFCGRYEQTVNDVYLRLPRLTTKGVLSWKEKEPAEKRNKRKNKRKAIQHFTHLAYIVVCLFVGCAGGVEECCV